MKIKNQELRKQFIDVFQSLTQRYNSHQVWCDFVIMSACTISNACDLRFYKEREEMYMDTVKRYKKEQFNYLIEPNEAEIVREIFLDYVNGKSLVEMQIENKN